MNKISGKMLLMIELAILLVFFCFAAAVCTHLFVSADKKTDDADVLSKAVVQTTSIAETLKATDGDLNKTAELLSDNPNVASFEIVDGDLILFYDQNFKPTDKSHRRFSAIVKKETSENYYSYSIDIMNGKIYSLSFKALKKGGGSNEVQ